MGGKPCKRPLFITACASDAKYVRWAVSHLTVGYRPISALLRPDHQLKAIIQRAFFGIAHAIAHSSMGNFVVDERGYYLA
jgi:hypothetical protein